MKLKPFFIIQICAFLIFIARAYQFYFFGAPFRAILWDENLMSPIIEGVFNTPWYDYATSSKTNKAIGNLTFFFSVVLFVSAFVSLFWKQIPYIRLKKSIIAFSLCILFLLGICMVKDKNYDFLQFFELTIQFAAPLVLYFSKDFETLNKGKLIFWLKVSIALTFIPHGLFAMGLIYVPGHFIDMTIKILAVTETQSRQFLFIVGLLDIIAAVFLFIPKLVKPAFIYIIIWGILTAIARVVAGFNYDFFLNSIHNFTYLTVYRLPHGLLPLATLILYGIYNKTLNTNTKH